MTIQFNKSAAFEDAKKELLNAMYNEDATKEQQSAAFTNFFDVIQDSVTKEAIGQATNAMNDNAILQSRGQNVLTNEEKTFFNAVIEGGFTEEKILPTSTQDRIFDDLVKAHPLLQAIGIQDLGAVTKFIYSNATKAYAWKDLFGEITGQANAAFTEESFTQLKLTSFLVIPNDMLDLGPTWVERYARTLLVEIISVGLEYGFVNGRGAAQKEPVGLMKNVDATTGAVTDKTASGTLTFAPSDKGEIVAGELYNVISALSVDAKGEAVNVAGKVVMVVNPTDAIAVQFRNTIQTASGQWVTALPYNIQVVESAEVPAGKAVFFVKGRYLAAIAGGYRLKKFDQTLAMEDATLYTVKQFANGKPADNKAALVYNLDIDFTPAP